MTIAGLVLALALSGCSDTHIGPGVDDDTGDDDTSPSDDDSSPEDDDTSPDDDSSPEDDDVTPDDDDDPSGCPEPAKPDCGDPLDADCDRTPDVEDCAPTDPWIHPGALEACGNLEDEDCDGLSLPCRREGEVLLHLDHPEGFDAAFTRSTPFAGVGSVASFIGDHDGDGWGDVLIGSYVPSDWACVLSGPFSGVLDLDVRPEACVARFNGLCGDLACIRDVERAGDVNGDGYDDLFLAADTYWDTYSHGGAVLFLGPLSGDLGPEDAAFVLRAAEAVGGDYIGLDPDLSVGDVNGDGEVDLLAVDGGYWGEIGGGPGGAAVFLGPLTGTHTWAEADAIIENHDLHNAIGASTGAGALMDLDGDGVHSAYIIGLAGGEGDYDYVVYGFDFISPGVDDVASATSVWTSDDPSGATVSWRERPPWVGPDGNRGCGVTWMRVGNANDGHGRHYAFEQPPPGDLLFTEMPDRLDGTSQWSASGPSVAGEVNGDGWADVVLGDDYNDTYDRGGVVSVVPGPISGTVTTDSALVHYHGQGDSSIIYGYPGVGAFVDTMDADGDGYGDLLIAAPIYFRSATESCNFTIDYPGVASCSEGAVFLELGGP